MQGDFNTYNFNDQWKGMEVQGSFRAPQSRRNAGENPEVFITHQQAPIDQSIFNNPNANPERARQLQMEGRCIRVGSDESSQSREGNLRPVRPLRPPRPPPPRQPSQDEIRVREEDYHKRASKAAAEHQEKAMVDFEAERERILNDTEHPRHPTQVHGKIEAMKAAMFARRAGRERAVDLLEVPLPNRSDTDAASLTFTPLGATTSGESAAILDHLRQCDLSLPTREGPISRAIHHGCREHCAWLQATQSHPELRSRWDVFMTKIRDGLGDAAAGGAADKAVGMGTKTAAIRTALASAISALFEVLLNDKCGGERKRQAMREAWAKIEQLEASQ